MQKISIIVPIYNTASYLRKCIESILNQTYEALELILVDDGSTDESEDICDEFCSRDSRVKVIHQENAGLVSARQVGLKNASYNKIMFVDSDDWIDSDLIERLLSYDADYDAIIPGYYKTFGDKDSTVTNLIAPGIYSDKNELDYLYKNMISTGSFFNTGIKAVLCTKLLRRDFLLELYEKTDKNITIGEDAAVLYPYLLMCKSIKVVDYCGYHYMQYPESMSQRLADNVDITSDRILYRHLITSVSGHYLEHELQKQVHDLMAHILIQRELNLFDKYPGQMRAFGELNRDSRILVYAAGRFGKQVYRYASTTRQGTLWADKQSEFYKEQGLPVENIADVPMDAYDEIVIAIIDSKIAQEVKLEIENIIGQIKPIHVLDVDFITSKETFQKLDYGY